MITAGETETLAFMFLGGMKVPSTCWMTAKRIATPSAFCQPS